MEGLRTGLRHRLDRALRRVEEQHRLLRDVDAELARVASNSASTEVSEWLTRKRDALLAHFEWEEEVVFPAVHGLVSGTEQELAQLERDHGEFLALLTRAIASDGSVRAEQLDTLRRRLATHEAHEERLVSLALAIEQPQNGR